MSDSASHSFPLIIPADKKAEQAEPGKTLHLPYGERMTRERYEQEKQSLQIELLKMQS